MKKIIIALVLIVGFSAHALTRTINETQDVSKAALSKKNMWILQAESIEYNLTCTMDGDAYALTNDNLVVVWEISAGEDYDTLYASSAGTITSATGGVVQLTLTPEESNITNGTYNGYVIAATFDGTDLSNRVVLARQKIIIGWSPYGLEYDAAGSAVPFYTKAISDSLYYTQTAADALFYSQTTADGLFYTKTAVSNLIESATSNSVTTIILNSVTNTPTDGVFDLGTIESGDTNAVTSVILNGTTNSPVDGVLDLGEVSTDISTVAPYVTLAGTADALGLYIDSGTLEGGKTLYTNDACKLQYYESTEKWQIVSTTGLDTLYYQKYAHETPWGDVVWKSVNGDDPMPFVTAVTNVVTLADVAASVDLAVQSIIVNGVTNLPTEGAVDLGDIGASVTNLTVETPNDLTVYDPVTNLTVRGFSYATINSDYDFSDTVSTNADAYYSNGAITIEQWDGEWQIYFYDESEDQYTYIGWGVESNVPAWEVESWVELVDPSIVVTLNESGQIVISNAVESVCNGTYTTTNAALSGFNAGYTNGTAVILSDDSNWLIYSDQSNEYSTYYSPYSTSATNPSLATIWIDQDNYIGTPDNYPVSALSKSGSVGAISEQLSRGLTESFTFLSSAGVTGQCWFASGILTDIDLNIGD